MITLTILAIALTILCSAIGIIVWPFMFIVADIFVAIAVIGLIVLGIKKLVEH